MLKYLLQGYFLLSLGHFWDKERTISNNLIKNNDEKVR